MCHPIVPETRWKAWNGREESAPPVAMPSSRCDVLDVAGRSGDCLHFSVLPSLCHAAGACLPAYPLPAPRVWWAVEAMRKEQTWKLEPPRNTFHDNLPTRHAAKTVDRLLSPPLYFTAARATWQLSRPFRQAMLLPLAKPPLLPLNVAAGFKFLPRSWSRQEQRCKEVKVRATLDSAESGLRPQNGARPDRAADLFCGPMNAVLCAVFEDHKVRHVVTSCPAEMSPGHCATQSARDCLLPLKNMTKPLINPP